MHLPFLLRLSSGMIDMCDESIACLNSDGEEEMDLSDDEFAGDEEEVAATAAQPSLLRANASRWDNFLQWVRDIETPWDTEDTDAYRESRALQYCNGTCAVSRDLLQLKPTMQSWVPHIACFIVPRQIIALGDPSRRAADACESYGSCAKKIIKFLTCRRKVTAKFGKGYIEQAFNRLAVRSGLLHGPENAPYQLRSDHNLVGTGRRGDGRGRAEGPHMLVRVKVEFETENA